MFSKELENLIQATLEDGVLEDYEKAALVKRATAEGVDLTELEIYINSILQKRKREHDQAEDAKQEKIDQKKKEAFGRVCPNCGRQVPPMTLKCECGYEFTNQNTASSVQILASKLEDISKREKSTFEAPINFEKNKLNDMIDTISVFPVPNSKEDIIEFLALAISKSKIKGGIWGTVGGRMKVVCIICAVAFIAGLFIGIINGEAGLGAIVGGTVAIYVLIFGVIFSTMGFQDVIRSNKLAVAWREKFEQVIIKGRSMRGDPEFTEQLNYYENLLEK